MSGRLAVRRPWFASITALAVLVALLATNVDGQVRHAARTTSETATPWIPPRTADGQPDLQGVWGNNSATPLQRPQAWAGRQFLTTEEVAEQFLLARSARPSCTLPTVQRTGRHPSDEKIYEYACHEGNLGMVGILSGHRAQEKKAAKGSQ